MLAEVELVDRRHRLHHTGLGLAGEPVAHLALGPDIAQLHEQVDVAGKQGTGHEGDEPHGPKGGTKPSMNDPPVARARPERMSLRRFCTAARR